MSIEDKVAIILKGLGMLRDLHYCQSVRASGEKCPICAMGDIIEEVKWRP